jgi:hypothetical protein
MSSLGHAVTALGYGLFPKVGGAARNVRYGKGRAVALLVEALCYKLFRVVQTQRSRRKPRMTKNTNM